MYDSIRGELLERLPTSVVVEAGGVGYRLVISLQTFAALPAAGAVKLLTHLHVQEDDLRLYGFASAEERQMFRMLRLVSGIGPTTAINILSGITPDKLRAAIAGGDTALLKTVRGIGKKLAERIVVELKDLAGAAPGPAVAGAPAQAAGPMLDAILALVSLGYARASAEEAVRRVLGEQGAGLPTADVIRSALRRI